MHNTGGTCLLVALMLLVFSMGCAQRTGDGAAPGTNAANSPNQAVLDGEIDAATEWLIRNEKCPVAHVRQTANESRVQLRRMLADQPTSLPASERRRLVVAALKEAGGYGGPLWPKY